jgi:tetratricopeptide (TPR) repeat protein
MEAYQCYLKGRALLYKRGTWIARALECFQQAVELDPRYADAWAGLADSYTTLAYYGFAPSVDTLPRALDAAKRAVEIDPDSAAAHSSLALAALLWDRDFETAEREFHRALALNPTYTQARCWHALMFLQATAGRLDEGVEEARRAVELDPLSGYAIACHTYALSNARRTSEALVQGHLAVESDPESFVAGWALGNACHWSGRFDEAVHAYERLLSMSGRHPWALVGLAATYATMGRDAEAKGLHAELLAQRGNRYVQPTMLAMSASAAGDQEAAIGSCRQCVPEVTRSSESSISSLWTSIACVPTRDSTASSPNSIADVTRSRVRPAAPGLQDRHTGSCCSLAAVDYLDRRECVDGAQWSHYRCHISDSECAS